MREKLFVNIFALAMLVLAASGLLFSNMLYRYYEEQAFADMVGDADYLIQSMEFTELGQMRFTGRVTLLDSNDAVLYDSRGIEEDFSDHKEVQQARASGSGRSEYSGESMLEKNLCYARLLPDGEVLRLCRQQAGLGTMMLQLASRVLLVVILVAVGAGAWSLHLARQITRPINAIVLDDPKSVYPELQPLTDRLREQNSTIRHQMDELRRRVREFSALTDNMSEGFLLLNGRGEVLTGNLSARENLGVGVRDNIYRRGSAALRQAVETALSGSRDEQRIPQEGRTLQMISSPVTVSGQVTGAVVLVMDVTEQEQREALRREFSANVSHELKTPLTSISGFAELMSQGLVPPEKMQEFSGDIYRECRHLMALVEDILRLSRMDEGAVQPEWEEVELHALAQDVVDSLESVAEKKNVHLMLQGETVTLIGERQMLREMIYNLCDNAVKYNRDGGDVIVTVSRTQGRPRISVADTGIGIPYAHQGRVFERFYRVDKSHSRAIGGTGLGLSIVKHAAQYHNARVELHSTPGKGTEITVTFDGYRAERKNV